MAGDFRAPWLAARNRPIAAAATAGATRPNQARLPRSGRRLILGEVAHRGGGRALFSRKLRETCRRAGLAQSTRSAGSFWRQVWMIESSDRPELRPQHRLREVGGGSGDLFHQ